MRSSRPSLLFTLIAACAGAAACRAPNPAFTTDEGPDGASVNRRDGAAGPDATRTNAADQGTGAGRDTAPVSPGADASGVSPSSDALPVRDTAPGSTDLAALPATDAAALPDRQVGASNDVAPPADAPLLPVPDVALPADVPLPADLALPDDAPSAPDTWSAPDAPPALDTPPAPDAPAPDAPASDASTTPDTSGAPDASSAPDGPTPATDASTLDVAPSAFTCPASPDLLACLRFENDTTDSSPRGLPTTATSPRFEPSLDGFALSGGGQTSVRVGPTNQLGLQRYTIEAWVKARTLPASGGRAGIVDNQAHYSMFVYGQTGTLRCDDGINPEVWVDGAVSIGAWIHLACVNDGQKLTAYVNGVARQSVTALALDAQGDQSFLVGQNAPSAGNPSPDPFDGLIDNVRLWRRALTQAELCTKANCAP